MSDSSSVQGVGAPGVPGRTFLASLLTVLGASPAAFGTETRERDDHTVSFETWLDAGAAAIATVNTNFGAGLETPGGRRLDNVDWYEGFVHPGIAGATGGPWGELYASVSAIAAFTRGEGDASGGTFGRPEKVEHEHLYAGWRSGDLFPALGRDAIDISVGAQDFEIGDGLLVSDGRMDEGEDAALYIGPRNTFKSSAIARIRTEPWYADLFYLDTREDSGGAQLVGANLEYVDPRRGTLGAYGFRILDVDIPDFAARDGLNVYSIRGQGRPFLEAPLDDLFLSFEVARQENNGTNREADALGGYGEVGYTFSALPWSPYLAYRFSSFSGDDPDTAENEAFDPLFVGSPRGWGTWFQGEIVGQYLFTNTNLDIHMAQFDLVPREDVVLHLFLYDFTFDEPRAAGATDDDFALEINAIADFAVSENLIVSAVYGVALPHEGGKQAFDDDAYHLFLLTGSISF